MIIGVDPHKSTHTATVVDAATNTAVASVRVAAGAAGYRRLLGSTPARTPPAACRARAVARRAHHNHLRGDTISKLADLGRICERPKSPSTSPTRSWPTR